MQSEVRMRPQEYQFMQHKRQKIIKRAVIKYGTEGAEDFVKICGKILGPNNWASENPIPQH